MNKKKILIHACCATCAGYVVQKLSSSYFPWIYFFNPNIHPEEEYLKRRNELKEYASRQGIPFLEEPYQPNIWFSLVQGLENEPEKGLRCKQCFSYRLEKTAVYALANNFRIFTTTLTISPHKDSKSILGIGQQIAEERHLLFLSEDFKKMNGFLKTIEIAKGEKFYRQNYCGCQFSLK